MWALNLASGKKKSGAKNDKCSKVESAAATAGGWQGVLLSYRQLDALDNRN